MLTTNVQILNLMVAVSCAASIATVCFVHVYKDRKRVPKFLKGITRPSPFSHNYVSSIMLASSCHVATICEIRSAYSFTRSNFPNIKGPKISEMGRKTLTSPPLKVIYHSLLELVMVNLCVQNLECLHQFQN